MPTAAKERKVIFADFASVKFNAVIQSLQKVDVICDTVTEMPALEKKLKEEHFDICVVNLLFGKVGPSELLSGLRAHTVNKDLKIIVITKQVQKVNVQIALKAGAQDFIGEPFEALNLYNRLLYHLGPVQVIEASGFDQSSLSVESNEYVRILVETIELLGKVRREDLQATFFGVLTLLAKLMDSNRTSLIVVDEENNSGAVLATSDDPKFFNFPVNLDKYPEIVHVMHTGSLIFIEDVSQNALTGAIKHSVKTIAIASLMVLPVNYHGDLVGVLVIRRPNVTELPPPEVVRVLQAIANVMAAHANVAAVLRKIYANFKPSEAA